MAATSRYVIVRQTTLLAFADDVFSAIKLARELMEKETVAGDLCVWCGGMLAAICCADGSLYTAEFRTAPEWADPDADATLDLTALWGDILDPEETGDKADPAPPLQSE
jgi:hypothetical protein